MDYQLIIKSARSGIDVDNFSVSDMGLFAQGNRSIKLLTLHKAKGREFDAVAVVRAHDGLIPYGNPRKARRKMRPEGSCTLG